MFLFTKKKSPILRAWHYICMAFQSPMSLPLNADSFLIEYLYLVRWITNDMLTPFRSLSLFDQRSLVHLLRNKIIKRNSSDSTGKRTTSRHAARPFSILFASSTCISVDVKRLTGIMGYLDQRVVWNQHIAVVRSPRISAESYLHGENTLSDSRQLHTKTSKSLKGSPQRINKVTCYGW